MSEISREEIAWRQEARERKKAGGGGGATIAGDEQLDSFASEKKV
jgi:hypothetical protein